MNRAWSGYFTFILILAQAGSDWTDCSNITECHCKWSSGKKTASCVSANLTQIPNLESEIQSLDLSGNPLRKLEANAFVNAGLINLQRLNLYLTSLQSEHVDTDAFRSLNLLVELDLSHNQLTYLSSDMFKDLEKLRRLNLNDNPIRALTAEQFPPLKRLRTLEISRCNLETIHPRAFVNLQALEVVNINQNSLQYLHLDTLIIPTLRLLLLSNNPWNCDCRLRNFHDWFARSFAGSEEVSCKLPESKSGMLWRFLRSEDFVCLPSAITSPTVIRTEAGAKISFGCLVTGDPIPTVSWSFHHKEQNNSSNIIISKNQVENLNEFNDDYLYKNAQWVNLTITNVTSELLGSWKCIARSPVGEAKASTNLKLPKPLS